MKTKTSKQLEKELKDNQVAIQNNKVVPSRLAKLLSESDYDQLSFAQALTASTGINVIRSNVSMWITGARRVPAKYVAHIANIFGVTVPYLIGLTENESTDWSTLDSEKKDPYAEIFENFKELAFADLYAYNRMPVYLKFENLQYPDGWAIYNRDEDTFVFADEKVREITIRNLKGVRIYTNNTSALDDPMESRESLDYNSFMKLDKVFIRMNSSHPVIHAIYDGWYRHNESRTCLINERGDTLPYDGFKTNYRAYGYRYMTQKTRTLNDK